MVNTKTQHLIENIKRNINSADASFTRARRDSITFGHGFPMSSGVYTPARGHCASAGYDVKVAQQTMTQIKNELKDANDAIKKLVNNITTELMNAYHDVDNVYTTTASVRFSSVKKNLDELLKLI